MKIITINNRRYNFPESWNELMCNQLTAVMQLLFLQKQSAERMLLELVKVLAGMSRYHFMRAPVEELEEFFYLLQFVLQPDFEFTKNLLPGYQHRYGPADALSNLRMKEFTFTEDLFMRWCESERQDLMTLDELVAILYRPAPAKYDLKKNPLGDNRCEYSQNVCQWEAKHIVNQWPLKVKLAIAHWYDGCRRFIVDCNPDVFSGGGDPARYGLVSVMLNVAEGGVFGTFDKVEEQYVNLVMMQLNEIVDKAAKIKAQTPS